MKLYWIQTIDKTCGGRFPQEDVLYRFVSRINGCKGECHYDEKSAIEDGEFHDKALRLMHPELNHL